MEDFFHFFQAEILCYARLIAQIDQVIFRTRYKTFSNCILFSDCLFQTVVTTVVFSTLRFAWRCKATFLFVTCAERFGHSVEFAHFSTSWRFKQRVPRKIASEQVRKRGRTADFTCCWVNRLLQCCLGLFPSSFLSCLPPPLSGSAYARASVFLVNIIRGSWTFWSWRRQHGEKTGRTKLISLPRFQFLSS